MVAGVGEMGCALGCEGAWEVVVPFVLGGEREEACCSVVWDWVSFASVVNLQALPSVVSIE